MTTSVLLPKPNRSDLAKRLPRDAAAEACQVAEGYFHAGPRTIIELLREFRVRTTVLIRGGPGILHRRTTDYSRMSYDALREMADNDAISDCMSD